jgi:hypothetical protein
MDHARIKEQLPALVSNFIPRNCRTFKYRIFDGHPFKAPALGIFVDPKPFEGKVVARTEEAIVIKEKGKQARFAVLDRALVTELPNEGAKVEVHPYARRRFDGERADTPEKETRIGSDGKPYTIQRRILGKAPARLPIPQPRCPELQQLIAQLEELPAPDGFRRITHLLVDANARDFTWVDPEPEDIIKTPPAITFSVSTAQFRGRVTVLYDRRYDLHAVELQRDGTLVERAEGVYFDMLGQTLERLIDDGSWRRIRVNIL